MKPDQEIPSTYFNNILKKDVKPLTVDDLPDETVEEFSRMVRTAFPDEGDETARRVRYLIPYILQAIDWNEYGIPLEAWQLKYYYRRDRFLRKTGLSYDAFLGHRLLTRAVDELGLESEPTFEFILFLKYYFDLRSALRHSPLEQLGRLREALETTGGDDVKMDVAVGGRHFKFENADFIRAVFSTISDNDLRRHSFSDTFEEGGARDKIRALDYYLVKTLLDYLPTRTGERRGRFSQAERNFSLSVLNFCGRLVGEDVEGLCSAENNATFDKLMRDFKDRPIPFAMELFL